MGKLITFLSTNKRNINVDLMTLKIGLKKRNEDLQFQYYIRPVNNENRFIRQNLLVARKHILKHYVKDIVCMDLSLPANVRMSSEGERLLLFVPFDYQFKDYYDDGFLKWLKKKSAFKNYTHIIAGSPFGKKLLEDVYHVEKEKIVDGLCFPLTVDLNNPKKCMEIRKKVERFYTDAKGKKIVSLLIEGTNKNTESSFKKFDLKKYLDTYGEEYFFITNNKELMNKASSLPYQYHKSIGAIHDVFLKSDLLYCSDMMITNVSRYLTAFVSTHKPVYYYDNGIYYCGRYMKEHYPECCIEKAEDLFEIPYDNFDAILQKQEAFCAEFSYEPNEKVYDVIGQIFQ